MSSFIKRLTEGWMGERNEKLEIVKIFADPKNDEYFGEHDADQQNAEIGLTAIEDWAKKTENWDLDIGATPIIKELEKRSIALERKGRSAMEEIAKSPKAEMKPETTIQDRLGLR